MDVVVNFAAESRNSLAVLDPERFFRTNVPCTQASLESCRRAGVRRFHHVSTCKVYGELALDETAFHEESPYRPRTHMTCRRPARTTPCGRARRRSTGGRQTPTLPGASLFQRIVPLTSTNRCSAICGQLRDDSPDCEGSARLDHCRAIDAVLRDGVVGETYHVGTGVEANVDQIADLVLDELGLPSSRKSVVADRPGHDRRYLLDSARIGRELGWRPEIGFEAGVRDTIRWYAANRAWWEPLLQRSTIDETAWATTAR
ncbi:GDP-mannose 4,6-dehydratase [Lentzea sp. JNUCC 0626]|uniref:GDP-mannose 4,6-dehydratase n=1 Tax=Lentzea sp. JNUCC 0626 TaxID=3367513 RepID=UPI003748CFCA